MIATTALFIVAVSFTGPAALAECSEDTPPFTLGLARPVSQSLHLTPAAIGLTHATPRPREIRTAPAPATRPVTSRRRPPRRLFRLFPRLIRRPARACSSGGL